MQIIRLALCFIIALIFIACSGSGAIQSSLNNSGWKAVSDPEGGQLYKFTVDPANNQIIYAVTGAGVFKSNSGGSNWFSIKKWEEDIIERLSIAIDPADSNTIYSTSSDGVYKTTDGGSSWLAVNNGIPAFNIGQYSGVYSTHALIIDPMNSEVIYVAVETSNTGTHSLFNLYKTTNAGSNWEPANNGLSAKSLYFLVFDPQNSQIIYAGTDKGVFKSNNCGSNWVNVNNGLTNTQVFSLTVDPNNSQVVYVIMNDGVYKTSNSGSSWSIVRNGVNNSLTIDPNNSQTIYITSPDNDLFVDHVYKTTNGGANWVEKSNGLPFSSVIKGQVFYGTSNIHVFTFDPIDSQVIYLAWRDRVYKTLDGGSNWIEVQIWDRPSDLIYTDVVGRFISSIFIGNQVGYILKEGVSGFYTTMN